MNPAITGTEPGLMGLAAASATVLVAVLFLRAAWHKAADFPRFLGFVAAYRLLPERLAEPAARLLVVLEAAAALLLVLPATRGLGAGLAVLLLLLYGGAMAANLSRGLRRIDCGCGGVPQPLSPALLLRNAVLALLALLPLVFPLGAMGLADAAAAVAGGFLLFLFLLLVEQLLANHGHLGLIREELSRPN